MLTHLLETEKPIVTVVIFIATFFAALTLGRLLKRRAGVRLGVLFQLFCLTLAFYVAGSFYGLSVGWRHHIDAAAIWLTTAFVLALVDRYLWDVYFEKRRQTPIPEFLRQVVALFVYLIASLIVLSVVYHAEGQLATLLAGSGILAIILGFAAQDLFGGIIAGIALQISRPYKVGDWLKVRRTIRRGDGDQLALDPVADQRRDLPGYSELRDRAGRRSSISIIRPRSMPCGSGWGSTTGPSEPGQGRSLSRGFERGGRGPDSADRVFVVDFAESAVIYEIKFSMGNHQAINEVSDAIRTNIWYELKRQRIPIPFPIRTLHLERRRQRAVPEGHAEAQAILRGRTAVRLPGRRTTRQHST